MNVTKSKRYSNKPLAVFQANQTCKKTFSTLSIITFRKDTSLEQTIVTNTILNNEKLMKTKNNNHREIRIPGKSNL